LVLGSIPRITLFFCLRLLYRSTIETWRARNVWLLRVRSARKRERSAQRPSVVSEQTKIVLNRLRVIEERTLRMKAGALLLSFILCGLGTTLAFVYFNPFGLVIDSLGFMVFLYAIFSKEEQEPKPYHALYDKRIAEEDYKCRYCAWFGKPGCKRQERLLNGKPCEDFSLSPWHE